MKHTARLFALLLVPALFTPALRGQYTNSYGYTFNNPISATANSMFWDKMNSRLIYRMMLKKKGYTNEQLNKMSTEQMLALLGGTAAAPEAKKAIPGAPSKFRMSGQYVLLPELVKSLTDNAEYQKALLEVFAQGIQAYEKEAAPETAKNIELIFDASNSMWGQIGGEAKISIARKVLTQIINGLPDSLSVGLRVYGHRYGLNDPKACTDTELLIPIGPIAKPQLIDTVNKIQLKGKTPLVLSVLEAIKDFEKLANGSVILITDGIESCNGDIKSIAPAIKKSGLELNVHIVGFDIKEKEARAELESIAKSTEGRYLDAKNAGELLLALEQTLRVEYQVLDEKGQEVASGTVGGEPVKLKEGTYTIRILLAPKPLETKITLRPGEQAAGILKKEAETWKLVR